MTATSHRALARAAGVMSEEGALAAGVEAFTVVKEGGRVLTRGSNNFNPKLTEAANKLLSELYK